MEIELLPYINAVKLPIKDLGNLLSEVGDPIAKEHFNAHVGRQYFATIGQEFFKWFIRDDEALLPYLYGACYSALQLAEAVSSLPCDDEQVRSKCIEISDACAALIQHYEALGAELYQQGLQQRAKDKQKWETFLARTSGNRS